MWIPRELAAALAEVGATRPAVVLTGCRQAGKTSLLVRAFPDHTYVSLDVPMIAEEAEHSGEGFLKQHQPPVIIDEVQYAPTLLRHVKADIDRHRDETGRFLITGSQDFSLMEGVTESLAGRSSVLSLHSLSAREYEAWSGTSLDRDGLVTWMLRGGYPELHSRSLDAERFFGDYLATYLERDVRSILGVRSLRDFDRFMRLCAARTGQLVSYSSLATDLGVSPNTVKSWLSVLEASNVVLLLEPFFENLGKRIVKTPKLYFLDTGLCSYLWVHVPRRTCCEARCSVRSSRLMFWVRSSDTLRTRVGGGRSTSIATTTAARWTSSSLRPAVSLSSSASGPNRLVRPGAGSRKSSHSSAPIASSRRRSSLRSEDRGARPTESPSPTVSGWSSCRASRDAGPAAQGT